MIPLSNILFLDIETVSQYEHFEELPDEVERTLDEERLKDCCATTRNEQTPQSIYDTRRDLR